VLAIQTAQQRLQVTPSRQSRVIRLSFDSRDPQLAQEVVNALGEVYMARDLESRSASAAKVRQWLSPQLAELKQKVDQAEARLQAYSRANALVFAGERETASDERLRQVQRDLAAAQAERMARESMLVMAKKATGDTMPPALDTGALRDLRARITELKRQRAEVAALFTDESQRVQRVQAQIDELESAYRREQSAIPERAENEFRAARMREDSLSAEYAARAAAALDEGRKRLRYEALKHEVDTNRRLYDAMSDRMNEADVATAIKPSAARILSPAKYPNLPYRPNLPLNVALGLGGGLCLGLVFTALRETWRNGIGSPLEATAILQLPALGTVPSAANGLVSSRLTARLLQRPANPDSVELVTWREKQSLVSESFREILASIVFNGDQRVLLVTSPEAAEGKTTVACNLAIALNEIGKRVLLIDGDRRRPSVHRIFHKSNEWGLSNLLDGGEASLEAPTIALVTATDIPGLFILPSGASRSWFSLLDSARMEAVINRFRTEFDYVLVDTPPALHFSEARLVSRYTDGVLLVVRANHTDSIRVREAAARLSAAGARILGIILNRWDHQRPDYSTRYRYARYER
jgi:capsular exopolysaccharide synthesis family protein